MSQLASHGQLRDGLMRWALFLVPGIVLLGFISAAVAGSGPGNPWFDGLVKPSIYPSASLFPVVWTVLYIMMGFAAAIVAAARGARGRGKALAVFAVQLVLNLIWSPVFFAQHSITGALIVILLLDLAVLATLVLFWKIRPAAGLLLVPYMLWIAFATVLTWEIRAANPDADGAKDTGAVQRIAI